MGSFSVAEFVGYQGLLVESHVDPLKHLAVTLHNLADLALYIIHLSIYPFEELLRGCLGGQFLGYLSVWHGPHFLYSSHINFQDS